MTRLFSIAGEYFRQHAFIGSLVATVLLWGLASVIRGWLKKRGDARAAVTKEKNLLEQQFLPGAYLPDSEQIDKVGGFQYLREFEILREEPEPAKKNGDESPGLTIGYEAYGKWNLSCIKSFPFSIGSSQTKCQLWLPREKEVAEEHAQVTREHGIYRIRAVQGAEILIDDKPVKSELQLQRGMRIKIGGCVLVIRPPAPPDQGSGSHRADFSPIAGEAGDPA